MTTMHDWTLVSISVDWQAANATFTFIDNDLHARELVALGFESLTLPRKNDWGPSASVYEATKTISECNRYSIQMQSGDLIEVEAVSIMLF